MLERVNEEIKLRTLVVRLPAAGLENMGLWRSQGMPLTRVGTSAESAFPGKQSISTHTTGFLPDRIEPENTSNLRIGSA